MSVNEVREIQLLMILLLVPMGLCLIVLATVTFMPPDLHFNHMAGIAGLLAILAGRLIRMCQIKVIRVRSFTVNVRSIIYTLFVILVLSDSIAGFDQYFISQGIRLSSMITGAWLMFVYAVFVEV